MLAGFLFELAEMVRDKLSIDLGRVISCRGKRYSGFSEVED